jgi:predicted ATPase/class 3 adenylate cyclase
MSVPVVRPTGTVTFLFTDIVGSTRLWEDDPAGMGLALAEHDERLRSAVEGRRGVLFKHTGDGLCAAFSSANDAVAAAVEAQLGLRLPVRMGLASGSAELREGDYFGPVLNRAARVMAAGHGGQIVLSGSTAGLTSAIDLVDLGMHRLRDLSGSEHLFQVRAAGLGTDFSALRTLDAVPGNLPVQATSFVGRESEVKQVSDVVRAHRLVTLTGVGGVGKTRLALQVAARLVNEFPDGVWLVELAPVDDPSAVPDLVAAALGVIPQGGEPVTGSVVKALSGRSLLILLDNCEHVLDAAADLVGAILLGTATVNVVATSREGLGVRSEHLWPVPSMQVDENGSEALDLFIERAVEVDPGFGQADKAEVGIAADICRRLDGLPLAIELAARRMVSMTAQDVRDRLDDRFRLLSGGHRGIERHQTLRQAVEWSYDLLDDAEKSVLARASVFAGGFNLAAASRLCDFSDEYAALDVLDSLVRKSLVTVHRVGGHTRYGLLETIRQYAAQQLEITDTSGEVRTAHARYFAGEIMQYWALWFGPEQGTSLEWLETEFANLRAGFRWAADHGDIDTATTMTAHALLIGFLLQMYEPLGWAEELLPVAIAGDISQLPRLYSAASLCVFVGRHSEGADYAHTALRLERNSYYDGFEPGVSTMCAAHAHLISQPERSLEIMAESLANQGWARAYGLSVYMYALPLTGRAADARALADEALMTVRHQGQPMCLTLALVGCGRAFADAEPGRALSAFREGLVVAKEHRFRLLENVLIREAASVETLCGDREAGLDLFDVALDAFHRADNQLSLALTFGGLAVVFDRLSQPEAAATIYGAGTRALVSLSMPNLAETLEHLGIVLNQAVFDRCVATGRAMETAEAVAYARQQVGLARDALRRSGDDGA